MSLFLHICFRCRWFGPALAAVLLLGSGGIAGSASADAVLAGPANPAQPEARLEGRVARLLLEAELGGAPALERAVRRMGATYEAGELLVTIEPEPGRSSATLDPAMIRALGGRITGASRKLVGVRAPLSSLVAISRLPGVGRVRLPYRAVAAGGAGGTISQALELVNADALQDEGVTGAGVKVAVIDLSFGSFAAAQATGDLPADAITVNFTADSFENGTGHGTSVAELMYDISPGVELHAIRIDNLVHLQQAADYVRDQAIDIVNLSVAFVGASYYDGSGAVSAVVDDSVNDHGIFWAVASGNWADKHWRGPWAGGETLEFEPGNTRLDLLATGGTICVDLSWNQYGAIQKTDLNLFIYDRNDNVAASSTLFQSPITDPYEHACYTYDDDLAPYQIEVRDAGGPPVDDVSLFSLGSKLDPIVTASSQLDPAVAVGAFTVGSIRFTHWDLDPPVLRGFSSRGPTTDGRVKPEMVAPDATSTSRATASVGTSFASPTVAGGAALVLQQDPTLTQAEIAAELASAAEDVGDPGQDNLFGHGKLMLPLLLTFDSDGDGFPNALDNCSHVPNVDQSDVGGLGAAGADGIGDVCQCGDVSADGSVDASDVDATRQLLAAIVGALPAPDRCNVRGAADGGVADCDVLDMVVLARTVGGLPAELEPGIGQVCSPALP